MKNKKIELLIKVSIPVIIIAGCFGIEKLISLHTEKSFSKPIIVSNDDLSLKDDSNSLEIVSKESYGDVQGLTENFGFINDNEVLLGIGLGREEFQKKYPNEIDKESTECDEFYRDVYSGTMNVFDLTKLTKKSLDIDVRNVNSDLISGSNKFSYVNDDKLYMYDLNNYSTNSYRNLEDMEGVYYENNEPKKDGKFCAGNWSKDGNCLISYNEGSLNIYNVKENDFKKLQVDNDDLRVSLIPSFYSEDGQDIYFIGRKYKKDLYAEGIFKVNSNTEKIEEVFLLPYVDTNSNDHKKYSGIIGDVANYYIFEDGNKVMFSGTIEGVDGTYIYNVEDNKFYNVIPHTVTAEEGSYVSSAWLSPDKTKVIYMNRAIEDYEEHWNLYAANVNGNSLTNRMCIYKDINLCGENIVWSPDSKKILFFTADEERMINYVPFPNKNEINIITFK